MRKDIRPPVFLIINGTMGWHFIVLIKVIMNLPLALAKIFVQNCIHLHFNSESLVQIAALATSIVRTKKLQYPKVHMY